MEEIVSKLRKWGRSIGVIIPIEAVKKQKLKEGDSVRLILLKKRNTLDETFGNLKFKRSTEEILRESDRELWND